MKTFDMNNSDSIIWPVEESNQIFFPPDKLESFLSHHHAASDRKQIFKMSNPLYVAAANLILKKEWDELEEKHYIQKKMTFCYNNGNNWL